MVPVIRKSEAGQRPASALSLASLALAVSLSGCGLIEDRSQRYVDARQLPPLEAPPEMEREEISQSMPIRELNDPSTTRMYPSDIPRPPDMTADILDENYVIEELGGRTWLLVNDVPPTLWPSVAAWMNERGLGVAYDSPQLGLLQSELANFSKQARTLLSLPANPVGEEPLVVVQARVAPGVRRKTTEISVRQIQVETDPEELLPWSGDQAASAADFVTQKQLLQDLSSFLQAREGNRSYSRAALGMTTEPLVRLETENEQPVAIRMDLDYGRAWTELNRAVQEAGFTVIDLDRSAGYIQIDERSAEERSGGWFSWFSDEEKPRHTATIRLATVDGTLKVTSSMAEDSEGPDRSAQVLSELYESLY
ncbi:MAG: outer membrane protein assembly factor BamC [Pseudomonadota bacterium]|nr:outer membrane protein assembly factor BamC [Pseudomonadota bacterium]